MVVVKEKARVVHEFDVAEHFIDVVVVVPKERDENNGRDYHSKQCPFFVVFGYSGKAFFYALGDLFPLGKGVDFPALFV